MNAKDLLAAIEAHAAEFGATPIHLAERVWHAAKQTFLLSYGEGSMFPAPGYPESFAWRGTPVVLDRNDRAGETEASRTIAELAVVPGPLAEPLAMHPGAPEARVMEGQPRPELDGQVAVEHFADERGVFQPPAPSEVGTTRGDVLDGGSAPGPDGDGGKTDDITGPQTNDPDAPPPAPRTAETLPEPTGFAAMSKKADGGEAPDATKAEGGAE